MGPCGNPALEPVPLISDQGVLVVLGDGRTVVVPSAKAGNNPVVTQGVSHCLILERQGIKDH